MNINMLIYTIPLFGVLALLFALQKTLWINKQDPGNDKIQEIGAAIREGSMAFIKREYAVIFWFVIVVSVLLVITNTGVIRLVALSFAFGAFCSALSGFIGMYVATAANMRTTNAARKGLAEALQVAFSGGTVMGMCVVGLGVFGLSMLLLIYTRVFGIEGSSLSSTVLPIINGFAMGALSIALFARVGGGIYTKGADVGADLVGKIEAGIPEDDPRNPATIADNVGDNVGDVCGMGADLFESYVGSIVGVMVLGAVTGFIELVMIPLIIAGAGIVMSILGTFFVRTKEGGNPQTALNTGVFGAGIALMIISYPLILIFAPAEFSLDGNIYKNTGIFWATAAGIIAGSLIGILTEYFTAEDKGTVAKIAESAMTGPATVIISGLSAGMKSTGPAVLCLCGAIFAAYHYAGLYGIAVAGLGMLATTGIQLAIDAYGPIADNSGGIAEMSGMPAEVRGRTDKLDAVGNTTAAIGKGFAIGSAALTALSLFVAFTQTVGIKSINILDPQVVIGLFLGGMLPFFFCSFALDAVGKTASLMVKEVRRQFREISGLLQGTAKPEYAKCVDIAATSAIKQMTVPSLIVVIAPVFIGILFGPDMLGGLLVGATITGVMLALFQANAGGAWDNAKKHIEGGAYGGKGSEAHKAAIIGDTVGDPFKDTAGPSLNILIKLMCVISLVIAPLIMKFHP